MTVQSRPAVFRHGHRGLREPQKVSLNRSLKLCHPLFPPLLSHTTNPLSAVFLSWSQIPPSSPLTNPPPPPPPSPPPLPRHCQKNTNTALCCADYRDILIKSDLKGRSRCERVNPHRSFTLFKQIRRGKGGGDCIHSGRQNPTLSFTKEGIVIARITGMGILF